MIYTTYDEWADAVGILKDTESREAWDYQQKRIELLEGQLTFFKRRVNDLPTSIMEDYFFPRGN